MCLTIDLLLQNCGAATVTSQKSPGGHDDVIDVFGVGAPKHKAYVVEFKQANRPSGLHVPHTGAQSKEIVGLIQTSDVSLHAVFDGQVIVTPFAAPFFEQKQKRKQSIWIEIHLIELIQHIYELPLKQNWNVLCEMHITPDVEPHWLHIADAHPMIVEKIHIKRISFGKYMSMNHALIKKIVYKIVTQNDSLTHLQLYNFAFTNFWLISYLVWSQDCSFFSFVCKIGGRNNISDKKTMSE